MIFAETYLLTLAVVLAVLPAACRPSNQQQVTRWPQGDSTYSFDDPEAIHQLDDDLDEISGLTLLDDDHLGAIQDEDGRLFVIDYRTGEVTDDAHFGHDGDYEGLAAVGRRLFILRSDGDVYEIDDWRADDLDADKHETRLSSDNNTEGLAYDAAHGRLLVACKGDAGEGLDGKRAIYAFDLSTMKVGDKPVYLLDVAAFNHSVDDDDPVDAAVRSALSPVADLSGFKPSGIAIHPLTGDVYVLSGVRQALVVVDAETGNVTAAWTLPEKYFNQPEGIAFLPNGDLFISNEKGDRHHATLLRFNYHPPG